MALTILKSKELQEKKQNKNGSRFYGQEQKEYKKNKTDQETEVV